MRKLRHKGAFPKNFKVLLFAFGNLTYLKFIFVYNISQESNFKFLSYYFNAFFCFISKSNLYMSLLLAFLVCSIGYQYFPAPILYLFNYGMDFGIVILPSESYFFEIGLSWLVLALLILELPCQVLHSIVGSSS